MASATVTILCAVAAPSLARCDPAPAPAASPFLRCQPEGTLPRILFIESAGWVRPGDGVSYFLGDTTAASYTESGGVLLLAASLSDHPTLAGVRSFLRRLHDEHGLRKEAVLPATSVSNDVDHLCDWDE